MAQRLLPQEATSAEIEALSEVVASLIVRSPQFRNRIRVGVEYFRKQMGLRDYAADKALIGLNMRNCQREFVRSIAGPEKSGTGKFCVLHSDSAEFIFGDGFLHNFNSPLATSSSLRCVLPLTPTIGVIYGQTLRCWSWPRVFTLRATVAEVAEINNIIQIYARDFLFYRTQRPAITDAFTRQQFLEFQYHRHPWADSIVDAMAETFFERPD